jgi:hypothetical protein
MSFFVSDLAVHVDLLVAGLATSTPSNWKVEPLPEAILARFPTGGVKSTLMGPSIDPIAEESIVEYALRLRRPG